MARPVGSFAVEVGTQVRTPGSPSQLGTVTSVVEVNGAIQAEVFVDGATKLWFPLLQLEPVVPGEVVVVDHEEFLVKLLLAKYRHALVDVLYSYRGSRTHFEVYQFKPVFKFLATDRRRLLIADEVGLGKTIEASLIYLELKARSDLPRTLILCPSSLKEKWRSELKFRFDEDFTILDTNAFERFLRDYDGTGGLQRLRGIASLEMIRRGDLQQRVADVGLNLDVLVVDEAHHARNSSTETHRAVRLISDRADNVVLLTATPLQTHTQDLFNIMQLVDPGAFDEAGLFDEYLRPNGAVNRAIHELGRMNPDLATVERHLVSLRRFPGISDHPILDWALKEITTPGEWTADRVVRLRRNLLELNSLAYVFTRTRKRDVKDIAKRTSVTHSIELDGVERVFYDSTLAYIRRRLAADPSTVIGFAMVMRERQAASCLPAMREYLLDLIAKRRSDLQYEGGGTELDEDADAMELGELAELGLLSELARDLGDRDSKFERLAALLSGLTREAAGSKVLIFSFFRRTIAHLQKRLEALGYSVFVMHGGVRPDDRQRVIAHFAAYEGTAILLSSEVGAEGLDFQFANTLVNYDLPWNPMKIEQRIGRIDRYGQSSSQIRIVNLVIADTIEQRILMRLLDRIKIFEESIGDLEPIVGPLVEKLTIDFLLAPPSAADQIALADRVALRLANLRAEQEDFEAKKAELMAQDSLFLSDVDDAVSGGRVVSATEVAAGLRRWLRSRFPMSDFTQTEPDVWLLKADPKLIAYFTNYLATQPDKSERAVELLHEMSRPLGVPCTFDDQLAMQRRPLQFLHYRHPLVSAALDSLRAMEDAEPSLDVTATRLTAPAGDLEPGDYWFFVNTLRVRAMTDQVRFAAVVLDEDGVSRPEIAARVLSLILEAGDLEQAFDDAGYRQRRDAHVGVMAALRDEVESVVMRHNDALIDARGASVKRTFNAKIAKRRQWLAEASDEKIKRMRTGEMDNLRAQLQLKLEELEAGRDVSVGYSLLLGGMLTLVPVDANALPPDDQAAAAPVLRRASRVSRRVAAPRKPSLAEDAMAPTLVNDAPTTGVEPVVEQPTHAGAPERVDESSAPGAATVSEGLLGRVARWLRGRR